MRIKIIANPKKDWAKELARELAAFITQNPKHKTVRRNADATICIGGDGTILYANYKKRIEGAILGIGSDKSYICQLHRDDWMGSIASLLESGKTVKVMTLDCSIGDKKFNVLNDAVVHATHYRVAEMNVSTETRNTKLETQFEGDGMIISTALGSAAYAYSAGGEKTGPIERKLIVVPICPYRRAFSPRVLPEDGRVSITVGSDCAFIIDGIFVRRLRKGEIVVASKGKELMFFEGVGTWD
jgi:NAD+ kinase